MIRLPELMKFLLQKNEKYVEKLSDGKDTFSILCIQEAVCCYEKVKGEQEHSCSVLCSDTQHEED